MSEMLRYPQADPEFTVALSLSLVLIGFDGHRLQVLLARSSKPPYEGALFLPSRYLGASDELSTSARQMFVELFGYDNPAGIEQLQAFGKVFRHPGGRVVNIAHYATVRTEDFRAEAWERHGMQWAPYTAVPELAFDHNEIVAYAQERFKRRVKRRPVGFSLLPDPFTLGQLQTLYETALGTPFDKRNFRKKLRKTDILLPLSTKADGRHPGQHKGALLFRFNTEKYEKLRLEGYDFLF